MDPIPQKIEELREAPLDRVEIYTESYARVYEKEKLRKEKMQDYISSAKIANSIGLGINAGHDLNLRNLGYFLKNVPNILEVLLDML